MKVQEQISRELGLLFVSNQTNRKWQIPVLAALCVGSPLLIGHFLGLTKYGFSASLGGLVILYLPTVGRVTNKVLTILIASFGFMVSYAVGQFLSFTPATAIVGFGVYAAVVHWIALYYKAAPPRSFFFIFIASLSICQPFHLSTIPTKVGMMALGTMFTCMMALIFIISSTDRKAEQVNATKDNVMDKNPIADWWEAIILGSFMAAALGAGYLLDFENPYWIPVSTAAVMQGASMYHIRQRTFYRIVGTLVDLGLCWAVLVSVESPLVMFLLIMLLQFVVELLIVKHYAWAVIFITPLAILLSEAAHPLVSEPNELIQLRLVETLIGSFLGVLGGWLLHKEKIRFASIHGLERITSGFKIDCLKK